MVPVLLVTVTLAVGQGQSSAATAAYARPRLGAPLTIEPLESTASVRARAPFTSTKEFRCAPPCFSSHSSCSIEWLRPWRAYDLQIKPFEPVANYCGCQGLFWCPKQEKKDDQQKQNGDNKKADSSKQENKKNDKEKNHDSEEKRNEEPRTLTPLMQMLQCCSPDHYDRIEKRGDKLYGWLQQGFTANFDSPHDRVNFGTNFNWRANDYRLNQFYLVYENTLEHDDKPNVGYRVDFVAGHDSPFLVSNGLFSAFTGFDRTSGFGVAGPNSFRQMNRVGIDLPQFFLETHLPSLITDKGIDIRVGRFYTLMGREVYPGKDTDFYSRTLENIVGTPYTHTGILATVHATDTLDVVAGVVRGWDVFEDNNNSPSYHGAFVWNSCDKRYNWTTAWITGPEQPGNNGNYRTVVTSYLTVLFGSQNQWRIATGGLYGVEANAAHDSATGKRYDAQWYDYSAHLFYTVDPRLTLGLRGEWFRDDDGARTAEFNRPGFAASFYDVTLGLTYKPFQNLRIRPELRFDWTPDARPFNDQRDRFQITAAVDMIWEF